MAKSGGQAEWPLLLCANQQEWEAWLDANHLESRGVRLQIAKKNAGLATVSYAEALESALCYGWIDSRKEALDERSWVQRFGPRGKDSLWSEINREKAERLIAEGRMKPSRTSGDRNGQSQRTLGFGLQAAKPRRAVSGAGGRLRRTSAGQGVLRHVKQPKQVRDCVSHP